MHNTITAFVLTFIAGLSTILGGLIIWSKKINYGRLSFALGFSAGIMVYLAFFELLRQAFQLSADLPVVSSFIFGLILGSLVDFFTHKIAGSKHLPECPENSGKQRSLYKVGLITAVALTLHNFPEGIATFITAGFDLHLGLCIALAIFIHNIPEGLCIALPIYYATKNKKKALQYTIIAALAEPLGALLALLFLRYYITSNILGYIYALVAGIMVYVALDELLPTARKMEKQHASLFGFFTGIIMMAVCLFLLK